MLEAHPVVVAVPKVRVQDQPEEPPTFGCERVQCATEGPVGTVVDGIGPFVGERERPQPGVVKIPVTCAAALEEPQIQGATLTLHGIGTAGCQRRVGQAGASLSGIVRIFLEVTVPVTVLDEPIDEATGGILPGGLVEGPARCPDALCGHGNVVDARAEGPIVKGPIRFQVVEVAQQPLHCPGYEVPPEPVRVLRHGIPKAFIAEREVKRGSTEGDRIQRAVGLSAQVMSGVVEDVTDDRSGLAVPFSGQCPQN